MYAEDDLLPLSGLQHLSFCERQWALIHLEGQWAENRLTAEGRVLHERSDQGARESRGDVVIARGVAVHSLRLGLVGKADVVEWHRADVGQHDTPQDGGLHLAGKTGCWRPMPVEYKRGRPKPERCDEVQLCAQALCLEEMLGVHIEHAAMFYGTPRRRMEVRLDGALRSETEALAARMHTLFREERTPTAQLEPKCRSCSLFEVCRPDATSRRTVARYLTREVFMPGS